MARAPCPLPSDWKGKQSGYGRDARATLKKEVPKLKATFLISAISIGLCVVGPTSANTLPVHVAPFNTNEYDSIVWGCRLSRCIHPYHENAQSWKGKTPDKELVARYERWLEDSGRDLIARWRAGEPITDPTDKLYLPLAKTEFWNSILMQGAKTWDGSKGYMRHHKFPDPAKFPGEERAVHEEYQAVLEAGLPVLHKIYNQQPLTEGDKEVFYDWAVAYYCSYFIGGVVPMALPMDSWHTFEQTLQAGRPIRQGDKLPNVELCNPWHFWSQPEFSETNTCDVSLHLRPDRVEELLDRYRAFARYWEPAETYPQVRPRCPPADAPDTESYRTLYNVLKEEQKPVLFCSWLINNDEGNLRLAPRLHLIHRAWRHKIGLVVAEGSVNGLIEKNDLRFDPSINEQVRTHLLRCFHAPFLPTPSFSPVRRFYHLPITAGTRFVTLINRRAEALGTYILNRMNGEFGGHLCGVLAMDRILIDGFRNGFTPDPAAAVQIDPVSMESTVPGRIEQCKANGYNISSYNRYANHHDAIGEIIAVDTDKHTVTLLQEEYHEEEYPTIALRERFPTTFAEYRDRDFRSNVSLSHWDELAARKEAGNSVEARTKAFTVNVGVAVFLNGEEQQNESSLEPGDVASIVYLEDKGGYPHFIRALRFNFPPVMAEPAAVTVAKDSGEHIVKLDGISDDNLIVDQAVTITARSSNPDLIPHPTVTYAPGNTEGQLVFTPAPGKAGTARITVTLTDDGGAFAGGADSSAAVFTVTVNEG